MKKPAQKTGGKNERLGNLLKLLVTTEGLFIAQSCPLRRLGNKGGGKEKEGRDYRGIQG